MINMTIEQWLSTELGQTIWKNKYQYGNETLSEWFTRMSGDNGDIKKLIVDKKFLFGGRTLANRGLNNGSYSNCYSSGYIPDSLDEIMQINTNLAMTYKAHGGQGASLSKIRPKGTLIKGRYESDGIMPIMEMYNKTTESISQAGARKGALMLSIDITHKEADTFITVKSDLNKINKANLSVEIDDVFMNMVDDSYKSAKELIMTCIREYEGQKIVYDIVPIKLYKLLIKQAHLSAEPGVLFTNKFRNYNLMEFIDSYQIENCNPCGEQPLPKDGACLTYNTLITTPNGSKKLGELSSKSVLGANNKIQTYSHLKNQGKKMVYIAELSNGLELEGTADHLLETITGEFVKLEDSSGVDIKILSGGNHMSIIDQNDPTAEMLGWIHGDGWYSTTLGISFNKEDGDYEIKDRILGEFINFFGVTTKPLKDDDQSFQLQSDKISCLEKAERVGMVKGKHIEKQLPTIFYTWNDVEQRSFIRGLFTADGSIAGKAKSQIYFSNSSHILIKEIQNYLASIGIHSRLYKTEFKKSNRNPQYRLAITKQSARIFMDIIGFSSRYKTEQFNHNAMKYSDEDSFKVVSITEKGVEEVFDIIEVSNTNTFYANGVAVHNCNLGSMNLAQYVDWGGDFDFRIFENDIYTCIEALDEIIDENLNNHALENQKEMAKNYRNIGLGVMGFGDMLIKMGLKYGSLEAVTFTKKLMKTLLKTSVRASVALADELGAFPMYEPQLFDAEILQGLFTENEVKEFKIKGIRNCSLLSIAPTGTLGTMLNISTGIEPNFALKYKRKTESLDGGKEKTFDVFAGIALEYTEKFNTTELPEYFVTSHDIDWVSRIDMQAAAQKYIDTAISSTINLHNKVKVSEVEELYLYAWKQGLKGTTIYRDGCREGVLSLNDDSIEKNDENFFVRGEILNSNVVHFTNDTTPWIAFVGTKNGKPFEIFSGPADLEVFPIPKSVKKGKIIKVKIEDQTRYDFEYIDSYDCKSTLGGLSRIFDKEYYNYARLISGMLRSQTDISSIINIVDGMHFESESLHSWKNGVIRALKIFVEDGTITKETCPECEGSMVYTGGCKQCSDCGWSKC